MASIRIKAPKGKWVVCRTRRTIGKIVRTRAEYRHLYEIMDEVDAFALEKQWKEEDRKKQEESMTPYEPPHTDPNDSTRT